MAETLVERVRYAVGIGKNDEFFRDTDIRDYLNASQHKVISYLIQNELNAFARQNLNHIISLTPQVIPKSPYEYLLSL
jgi:hypothetical protein